MGKFLTRIPVAIEANNMEDHGQEQDKHGRFIEVPEEQESDAGNPKSPQPPSLRSVSNTAMTPSSTPLGHINAARRPGPQPSSRGKSSGLTLDIQEKMKAFSLSRQGAPPGQHMPPAPPVMNPKSKSFGGSPTVASPPQGPLVGGLNPSASAGTGNPRMPQPSRPQPSNWPTMPNVGAQSSPGPKPGGLAAKRGLNRGMKLSDVGAGSSPGSNKSLNLSAGETSGQPSKSPTDSHFSKYSEFVDTKTGMLKFKDKAVIHGKGIDFSSGRSFEISLDDVETIDELGKGNYGTVYKVRHSRPRYRKRGMGLKGSMTTPGGTVEHMLSPPSEEEAKTTNVIMAMKEIRLELDEAKFTAIIMELDILHRCVSPFIIDFYGAFFQEGAVYICVEYMDGGSMEKLYRDGVPENILRKIALSTIMGLKSLKDEHNIIHRDVKPTNILINTKGQIKICDFGVSGNLVASIAKTNIGCQSYMAPERISGGAQPTGPDGATYSVQSDVWSLGLTVIECAMGKYPYSAETYNNIFSQLNAIVQGKPPELPEEGYSQQAKNFVNCCLNKNPSLRPTYAQLIRHPWLKSLMEPPKPEEGQEPASPPDMAAPHDTADEEVAAWVKDAIDRRLRNVTGHPSRPPLHAVPLDAVPGSPLLDDPSAMDPF